MLYFLNIIILPFIYLPLFLLIVNFLNICFRNLTVSNTTMEFIIVSHIIFVWLCQLHSWVFVMSMCMMGMVRIIGSITSLLGETGSKFGVQLILEILFRGKSFLFLLSSTWNHFCISLFLLVILLKSSNSSFLWFECLRIHSMLSHQFLRSLLDIDFSSNSWEYWWPSSWSWRPHGIIWTDSIWIVIKVISLVNSFWVQILIID